MKRIARKALIATVALGAVLVVQAPAEAYGPTANSLGCRIYFTDTGTGSSPSTWADTFTLTQSPAKPAPGAKVTVSLTAAAGTTNGPVPLDAGSVPVIATVGISGSQTGTVTLNQPTYPAAATAAYAKLGGFTATGSFTAGSAGDLTLTVKQVKFANTTASTYCSAEGDRDHKAGPVDTTIVQAVSVVDSGIAVTGISGQTVTDSARAGNTISWKVSGLAAGATLTAQLKDGSAGGTGEGAGTGTTDATGAGTGTLAVPAGATTGKRTLVVSDGADTLSVPITILGTPKITLSPAAGGAGTTTTVKGTDFNPGSTIAVRGYQALTGAPPPPATTDAAVSATAGTDGTFSAAFTVNDKATAYIGALSGSLYALSAWSMSADACTAPTGSTCNLTFQLSQTVNAGSLSMSRGSGASTITFSGITLNGSAQTATAALPAINVTDFRGSTLPWSLTAKVTDFTGVPGGTIAGSALTVTPSCAAHAGATNPVTAVAGDAGVSLGGDGATICSGPDGKTALTGGSFDAAGDLSLAVPANLFAGTYAATLTLTLG
ncbi:WxL domain-containing protein [Actinoplanes sp. HUAS TT8]|uniref:WxL domain-containing protein n=1 Tax=Actinoplanes sp. HUAS TT8 TaxID=3447453 RepID=UPI003F51B28B